MLQLEYDTSFEILVNQLEAARKRFRFAACEDKTHTYEELLQLKEEFHHLLSQRPNLHLPML